MTTARSAVSREGTQATKHDLLRNLLQEQSLGQMFPKALCAAPAVPSSPKFVKLSQLYRRDIEEDVLRDGPLCFPLPGRQPGLAGRSCLAADSSGRGAARLPARPQC